ncbi:MAG TPA: hypothetical protein VLA80_11200, partial [Actinomycetota bacterium]|nr:hypothetical protein [Actinomycetota bacterium]
LEAAPAQAPAAMAPDAGRPGWRRRGPLVGLAAALALAVVAAAVLLWSGPLRPYRPDSTVPLAGSAPWPPAARPAWPATTASGR